MVSGKIINNLDKYPLSNVQKKLFVHHQFYPQDPSYNLSYCYKVEGDIDRSRFTAVWEMLFNNAGVFKVHFGHGDEGPYQVYDSSRKVKLEVEYLPQPMIEDHCDHFVRDAMTIASQTYLDLGQWPISCLKAYYGEKFNYFTLNIPHIIFDGYSSYNLFNEFSRLYNSEKSLDEIDLELRGSSNEVSYFEETKEEQVTVNEKAIAYFRDEFLNIESLNIAELEQNRDEQGRLLGQDKCFDLTPALSEEVRSYIERHQLTDFSLFLAVHVVLLHKLFSQNKVIVGIPLPNRSKQSKTTYGYYVNSLPMVVDVQSVDTFRELCRTIKRKTMNLIRYQNFDYRAHVSEIFPIKNDASSSNFNTLFTYYLQMLSFSIDQCKVTQIPVASKYLNFPLTSSVQRLDDTYRVKIEYGTYLKQADLESIYLTILQSILSEDDRQIKTIPLMQKEEANWLEKILQPSQQFRANGTLHSRFEEQARNYPQQVAVQFGDEKWTYQQLDERSNQIAHFINKHMPLMADKIVISMQRDTVLIAIILGVLKSGRAYVPVDPIMPAGRLNYILSDLNDPPCLTQLDCLDKLSEARNVYVWENIVREIDVMKQTTLNRNEDSEELAYVIYTSGSTGNPKGVMVTHQNVLRSFKASEQEFNFQHEDTWLLYHSYGFDPSLWEIFGALLYGGKVVVVDERRRKAPDEIYKLLINEKVTMLQMTPSALQQLIDIVRRQGNIEDMALKCMMIGGETLHFSILKPWIDRYGDCHPRLYNVYGPTETTIVATYYRIISNDVEHEVKSIIGRPLLDVKLYIKNKFMDNLPTGVPGELFIGGGGVSKGYYNRGDITEERFLSGISQDGKVYRTGDQVKMLPNGNLEFMERIDNQVQIRGYRVELGEIEAVLLKYPYCNKSVVTLNEQFGKRLVVYMVMEVGHHADEQDMKTFLRTQLPEYMIPSIWIQVPNIPMTVNGKVDYKSLAAPVLAQSTNILEGDSAQQKIIAIWKQVLKTDDVQADNNFFDIGGTSLLVTEVYYKLIDTFHFEKQLSMIELFDYTTPRALAAYLNQLVDQSNAVTAETQPNKRKAALLRRRSAT